MSEERPMLVVLMAWAFPLEMKAEVCLGSSSRDWTMSGASRFLPRVSRAVVLFGMKVLLPKLKAGSSRGPRCWSLQKTGAKPEPPS
ncbi:hypothetical protein BDP55DRAFT_669579 [Colletotrichum godetiae]|uniref:Secreted protein n=1 Tax=Colletotrichum godetiae TaxID=1209918 RepID=A0AAJ0ES75_9PEZI|nr:uncharacterized protein BDP55DRAFT_669579 [Colletotrichum godetiae]KAK1673567.1 hypothetical protein BDP55DRAFT_669579 [Colletotrichum godetiae]